MKIIPGKKYRHYRTEQSYEVIGLALHSETHQELVIYQALYHCEQFGDLRIWARDKEMFLELVDHQGKQVPRFQLID